MPSFRTILTSGAALLIVAMSGACSSSSSDDDDGDGITFSSKIEPLVQEKCQRCHREGGIAPFSLVTYEDVKAMGEIAKIKVEKREMPPWGAFNDPACTVNHKFKDDLSLTDEQVTLFSQWVDRGMPLGNTAKRPPPKTFGASGLFDKTHTFQMAKPYELATGKDDIRCFPIDPGFTQDTWIGGSNVVPGDPRVVHHVIVYTDPKHEGMTKAGAEGNYPCFGGPQVKSPSLLLAWAPGVPPTSYGEEAGLKVEKGSHLIMQVHYHPTSQAAHDQTTVELKALSYKPGYVAQVVLAGNAEKANDDVLRLLPGPDDPPSGPAFVIPSNVKGHTESMELTIPEKIGDVAVPELSVYSVGAHMHWAGVDMKIDVERKAAASGEPPKECLLGTPKYDFNWQRGYAYDEPFDKLPVVRAGDKLRFTCTYDNTTGNPHVSKAMAEQRMSTPPEIRLGETTLDEMCLGAIVVVRRANLLD